MVHEIGTAEGLALDIERLQVYAVQLVYLIFLIGIEASHLDSGQVLVLERLGLPPEEYTLRLRFVDVHQRGQADFIVGRHKAVEVAKLHNRTDALILGNGLAAESLLVVGHVLRLDLHAEASAHGHVNAILHGCGAEDGVVGRGGDVRGHGDGGEEIRGAPLHIDALEGIGIVGDPELIEPGQHTPVGTSATRGTGLDGEVGVFGTDALAGLL